MAGWNHDNASWRLKECPVCKESFTPKSGIHKFCSPECKGKWKYITGSGSTEEQYKEISGNWVRYCSRLVQSISRKEAKLTRAIVLRVLEKQNYLCALSGEPLECQLEVGVRNQRNASIDRIIPGGQYTEDNIQIVCRALNSWRADTPLPDFIDWCRKVADYSGQRS